MVSLRQFSGLALVWASAFLIGAAAQATVLYTGDMTVALADPTQLGRLSRNGIAQDWSGGEPFPGEINPTTTYHYATLDLDLGALEAGYVYGPYIQVEFDSTATTTFLASYLNSYSPTNKNVNWLGDAGTSGNFFGTDPLFFQVVVPSSNHLLLVLNNSGANNGSGGIGLTGTVTVEAFADTLYTDLQVPVPEAQTWLLMLCGLSVLALVRRKCV